MGYKYNVYGGKGAKIYNHRLLSTAKARAKLLSLKATANKQAFVVSADMNKRIATYNNGKKI